MEKYDVSLHGYVFMINHIHLLISVPTAEGVKRCIQYTLRESSRKITIDLESFLDGQYANQARAILDVFAAHANGKAHYAVWKEQARGIPIWTRKIFEEKLKYIHENPIRAKTVSEPLNYSFSSFRAVYLNEEGILPISPATF